jgi:membrane-bound metal-dependent hydrolase YbcI (DUF457 family)
MCLVWSVVAAAVAFLFSRNRRASLLIGSMVFSHWLLDFIVYPNMPVFFDSSPAIGLGLITSGPGLILGILLEFGLIAGGFTVFWMNRKRTTIQARG